MSHKRLPQSEYDNLPRIITPLGLASYLYTNGRIAFDIPTAGGNNAVYTRRIEVLLLGADPSLWRFSIWCETSHRGFLPTSISQQEIAQWIELIRGIISPTKIDTTKSVVSSGKPSGEPSGEAVLRLIEELDPRKEAKDADQ